MKKISPKQKKQLLILGAILIGTAATILMVKTVQDLRSKAFDAGRAFEMTDENGSGLQVLDLNQNTNTFRYRRTSNTVWLKIKDSQQ